MSKQNRIIVAGHISLDITPVFYNEEGIDSAKLLSPGKLIEVGDAHIHAGGAVSNTGLALHRLGANALLMSKIGSDSFGHILETCLSETGATIELIRVDNGSTPYSIVIAPKGMDRLFLHNPGCNHTYGPDEIDFAKIETGAHFHFGYPTLMKRYYQNNGRELVNLFQRVKEKGLTTSLDMTLVDPESEAGQCDWQAILQKTLPFVDFFVPSIEELGYMLDQSLYEDWQLRSAGDDVTKFLSVEKDVRPLAEKALQLGCKAILLKCGVAGLYLKTSPQSTMLTLGEAYRDWGSMDHFEKSYVPDCVLSATGAGDTSIAAFLKAMQDGYRPLECVQFAAGTGASCVAAYDSLSGLLSFSELEKKIEQGWAKQNWIAD